MKKTVKMLLAAAVAGMLCFSGAALVACGGKGEGKSAYDIAVENGFVGTEQEWLDSLVTEGKSAYDIAVENGFVGTEQEWLDSLKLTVKSTDVTYDVDANGYTVANFTLTMSDNSKIEKQVTMPRRVISANIRGGVILTAAEAAAKDNLAGVSWTVLYDDGSFGVLPVGKSQIVSVQPYSEDHYSAPEWNGTFEQGGVYHFNFSFGEHWYETYSAEVYICDNLTTLDSYKEDTARLNYDVNAVRVNEKIEANTLYIAQNYNLDEKLNEKYNGEYYGQRYFADCTAVAENMLTAVDTSSTGYKEIKVTDNGKIYTTSVEVYDPSVTVVRSLYFEDSNLNYGVELTEGDSIANILDPYKNKKAEADFYEFVNDKNRETITVTADMLAHDIDTSKPGAYSITVTYKGYVHEIAVRVNPDMTTAQLEHTLTNSGAMTIFNIVMGDSVEKLELYDNGYAIAYDSSDNPLTEYIGYLGYTLSGNSLEVTYNGEKIAIVAADTENNTFGAFDFTSLTPLKTYTGSVPMGGSEPSSITIKTYANGFGEMTLGEGQQSMTMVIGYTLDGSTLAINPADFEMSFTVGAGDKITVNM